MAGNWQVWSWNPRVGWLVVDEGGEQYARAGADRRNTSVAEFEIPDARFVALRPGMTPHEIVEAEIVEADLVKEDGGVYSIPDPPSFPGTADAAWADFFDALAARPAAAPPETVQGRAALLADEFAGWVAAFKPGGPCDEDFDIYDWATKAAALLREIAAAPEAGQ